LDARCSSEATVRANLMVARPFGQMRRLSRSADNEPRRHRPAFGRDVAVLSDHGTAQAIVIRPLANASGLELGSGPGCDAVGV
jgi:hypothetical protein